MGDKGSCSMQCALAHFRASSGAFRGEADLNEILLRLSEMPNALKSCVDFKIITNECLI